MSVCVSVCCLSTRDHILWDNTSNLHQIFVHVTYGLVLLWLLCDTFCTSGCTDDVMLPYNGWLRGVVVSGVCRMNEVNARQARLVPRWVTVFGRVYHLGM